MMNPFDIQEWKPTFCKTEKELNAFWEENQIAKKKLIKINAFKTCNFLCYKLSFAWIVATASKWRWCQIW